jgi:regulatory protein YycI of two-component signal transduction system YycFG
MDRTDRNEKDDAQKAKLIFLSLAVLVAVLLIWSFAAASKARSERNAAKQELEMTKQDNAKLEQMLKDATQENETLKNKVQQLEARAKARPAVKKSRASKGKGAAKRSKKKTSKTKKHR